MFCFLLLGFLRCCAVTAVTDANTALDMLRERKFHLVITDVVRPDIDGFKLLELIGLEMDIPVISKFLVTRTRCLPFLCMLFL